MHFITLNSPQLIEEVPLFFGFDHSLGARAEICQKKIIGKKIYYEIIWPLANSRLWQTCNLNFEVKYQAFQIKINTLKEFP